ncbi:MAG: hypothetical protein HY721_19030 [Planctomycetes bacterium]|nr:hypothetical protein [Planctomycetota bacterium]
MRRLCTFGLGLGVGLLLASLLGGFGPRALGRGSGGAVSGNGDVNGDGQINLSDAVHLLNWLFRGGAEPVPIDCSQPPPGKARIRLLNVLKCADQPFPARLDACDGTVTDSFDQAGTSSICKEVEAAPDCKVRVFANTAQCGPIELCGELKAEEGHVYDFVLTVTDQGQPILGYFDQQLDAAGECPPFPTGGVASGVITGPCAAGAAGAADGAGAGGSVGWSRGR